MAKILLTGFTPFDGRDINASWVAAQTFTDANHLEIPVVWGQPLSLLSTAITEHKPDIVISLGEGHEGYFAIETRARNSRKQRKDNNNDMPESDIVPGGPDALPASIDTIAIQQQLSRWAIPVKTSEDAGQFLCEETLYCLETLKIEQPGIAKVVFTHLPPYGTSVQYQNQERVIDESLLKDFVKRLVDVVENL